MEEKLRMCSNRKARLPDMSGIDIMKETKEVVPSVLVIIVTANGDEEVAGEAFRGGRNYLKKPFSISDPSRSNTFVVYAIIRRVQIPCFKEVIPCCVL